LKLPSIDAVDLHAIDAGVHDGQEEVEQDDAGNHVVKVPHHKSRNSRRPGRCFDKFGMTRIKKRPEEGLDDVRIFENYNLNQW
jgi:hypothetical protein